MRTQISDDLRSAIRKSPKRQHQIARECGTHPVTLSNWMTGARDVMLNDPRVIAIGRALDLAPDQCFATARSESAATMVPGEAK